MKNKTQWYYDILTAFEYHHINICIYRDIIYKIKYILKYPWGKSTDILKYIYSHVKAVYICVCALWDVFFGLYKATMWLCSSFLI